MRSLIFILIGAAVAGCASEDHRAQIKLSDEVLVSLIVSPMFGLHSDWHRKLVIETPAGALKSDLFEDTGWWRGSNLYRHSSGIYVLHEGQVGCVLFRTEPPELVRDPSISCDKTDVPDTHDALQIAVSTMEFPASRFYSDLQYIGQFVETPLRQNPISFIGADEQPEKELPDIM